MTGIRVGIDVGGTFTDFVLAVPATGRLHHHKEPSDPASPAVPVARGLEALLRQAGAGAADVELFVHGTTLGLNAILQRRGARLALVVSRGNRDVLEIARSRMPAAYDVFSAREPPLVPRDRVFEVGARLGADGAVVAEPAEAEIDALCQRLAAAEVSAAAIMLLNSYRDGALERRLAAAIARRLPGLPLTCSAEVWPEVREYERALVATLNAFIQPIMLDYFAELERRLRALGLACPIAIAASNGGTIGIETARARPIETVLSGPAAGAAAAARLAARLGIARAITIDMGGTSSDMAVIEDGRPAVTTTGRIGDYPLIMPMVSISAIGAGGGSIAWRDAQGVLKVGPQSAGAAPGPVCYGLGGTEPTVTDAYVVTGILAPDRFLGGRMKLDRARAVQAYGRLGREIGLDGADCAERAAAAVLRVATAKMAVELSKQLALRGLDARDFSLVAFGGAGATHAGMLAAEARLGRVVIPPGPATFCALGGVLADVRRDFAATLRVDLDGGAAGAGAVAERLARLEEDAARWLSSELPGGARGQIARAIDLRYPAQAHELTIEVPPGPFDAEALRQAFHATHKRLYGFAEPEAPVQTNTLRASAVAERPPLDWAPARKGPAPGPSDRRRVYQDGGWCEVPVFERFALPAGASVGGPALVEQPDATIWIPSGWQARVDGIACLHLAPSP